MLLANSTNYQRWLIPYRNVACWFVFASVSLLGMNQVLAQSIGSGTLPPPLEPQLSAPGTAGGMEYPPYPAVPSVDMENLLNDYAPGASSETIISSSTVIEPLPMSEQRVAWYRRYPWLWVPMDGWTNSVEFGLNGSTGNSETTSIQTGADLKRETDVYTFSVDIDYQRTQAAGNETQNNGRLNTSFDRLLGGTPWSAFVKTGLEYDEFKAFDLRFNINSGLGYYWVRSESTTFVTRFGAGTSREFGGPDDSWVPEAVFGYEASHQLTERQKIKGQLEYFPQWDDFSSYRIVSDVSWEILLDGVDNLSLKLAATDRYDSTPQGLKPNDLFYSALLLWKF